VYAHHDLFVFPALWEEPLARVYLESLAAGTPIITSEYGSIADIVGEAGWLTDGSIADFQETLIECVKTNALPEMSAAAETQVEQFHLESVIDRIESMYNETVE